MPYRTKRQRTNVRRRVISRRKPVRRRRRRMPMYITPYPKVKYARLRYSDIYKTITPTTATAGTLQYSCNGLYDVDPAVGGHQPMYFDEMMAAYDHYTVLGSKITFQVFPQAGEDPIAYMAYIDDVTSPSTDIMEAAENHGSRFKTTSDLALGSGGPSKIVVSKTWSLRKQTNNNPTDKWTGNASANPNEEQFYTLMAQSLNASAAPSPLRVCVQISYLVKFTERREVNQS